MAITPLPPVYASDTVLDGLTTPELLLVTTLRLFASIRPRERGVHADWRSGLGAAGLAKSAAPHFLDLFRIVAIVPLRRIEVRCTCAPTLAYDEGRFLQMISLAQRDRPNEALMALRDWLPAAAASMALPAAIKLAAALHLRGLVVPLRHCCAAQSDQIASPYTDRGIALVH